VPEDFNEELNLDKSNLPVSTLTAYYNATYNEEAAVRAS
jgi:hypothetical protein